VPTPSEVPTTPATAPATAEPSSTTATIAPPTTDPNAPTEPTTGTVVPTAPPTTSTPTTVATETGPLVTWNGAATYIHGANLPWYNFGQDFGGGSSGGGASSPGVAAAVTQAVVQATAAGMNVIRWWLFPGQPTQFLVDAAGLPTGLAPNVFTDMDAALAIARNNRIAYTFTLFSAPSVLPADWVTTQEIMTWDVINEPEFDVWNGLANEDDVRALIKAIVDAAHATTRIPVTVGGARLDGVALLLGLGLDYYTIHWYDPMSGPDECLACANASDVRAVFGIAEPIVVGEFAAYPDTNRFQLWYDHGYAGGLPWSLLPDRTSDGITIDFASARTFAEQIGLL
jgi:hypothetical protein